VSASISFGLVSGLAVWQDRISLVEQEPGRFDLALSLVPAAKAIDLRDVTTVVIMPRQGGVVLRLEELSLTKRPSPTKPQRRTGFWVWDYRDATAQATSLFEACRSIHCTRLAVQMPALDEPPDLWQRYVALLESAEQQGIEAFALDGYPEAVENVQPLISKVERLREIMNGRLPVGVQLDIEPYLLDGFLNDPHGFEKYLDAHARVKRALAGQARLSIVMPFWLTSQTVHDRAVAFSRWIWPTKSPS